MTEQQYFDLVHLAERLKDNTRHCVTSQGRAESVAEHSWRLAFMAMLLKGEVENIDLGRVLEMCILHDLGEAMTGDIPSFWKTEADEQKEESGIFDLVDTLPEPLQSHWRALFLEMQALESKEAKLYKALDKLEAVIQHNESPLESWLPLEKELNLIYGAEEAAKSEPFIQRLRAKAADDTREKLKDQAKEKAKDKAAEKGDM